MAGNTIHYGTTAKIQASNRALTENDITFVGTSSHILVSYIAFRSLSLARSAADYYDAFFYIRPIRFGSVSFALFACQIPVSEQILDIHFIFMKRLASAGSADVFSLSNCASSGDGIQLTTC